MSQKIKKVAVIGTGVLGTQISMLSAYTGYKVSVYDPIAGAFEDTYKKLSTDFKTKEKSQFASAERFADELSIFPGGVTSCISRTSIS